jgi:putative SOS response-associated peptidase YedK
VPRSTRPFNRGRATGRLRSWRKWLDHDAAIKRVHALLKSYPADLMAVSEANALVNAPKNEGPQLLDPAA